MNTHEHSFSPPHAAAGAGPAAAATAATFLPLRLAFVGVPIVAGLDKFFGILADWQSYLAPAIRDALPVSPEAFLGIVGIVEIAVGVLMATRYVKWAAIAASLWLTAIALQLVAAGSLDVAVRDLVMAIAAFTLARVSPSPSPAAASQPAVGAHA